MSELIQIKGLERSDEQRHEQSTKTGQPALVDLRSSILDLQSSIRDPQSSIVDSESSTLNSSSSLDPRVTGKRYWRSLEELADTDEFQEILHREFPDAPLHRADTQ